MTDDGSTSRAKAKVMYALNYFEEDQPDQLVNWLPVDSETFSKLVRMGATMDNGVDAATDFSRGHRSRELDKP